MGANGDAPQWGLAIALVRTLRRYKQQELADLAGVGRSHQCLIEAGKRTPSMDVIRRQAAALEVPVSALARIAEDPTVAMGLSR